MDAPLAIDVAQPSGAPGAPAVAAASGATGVSFHEVLTTLNPLQYLPVVGNIFRALTGDGPPEPVRVIGSFIASALIGGPVGMVLNAMVTAVEKLTGLDPDHILHEAMAGVGMVAEAAPAAIEADPVQTRVAAAAYAHTMQFDGPALGRG